MPRTASSYRGKVSWLGWLHETAVLTLSHICLIHVAGGVDSGLGKPSTAFTNAMPVSP